MGWLQVDLSPDLLGTVVDLEGGVGGKRRGIGALESGV